MRFLGRALRFLFWFFVATWLGRKLIGWLFPAETSRQSQRPATAAKPLYRDPWCGTHVSEEISYTLQEGTQSLHFCSAECRDLYGNARRQAVGT